MKRNRILRTIFIILVIILISLISFAGIYVIDKNSTKNMVKDYTLGRDLLGSRRVQLDVSNATNEIKYDKDGNKIEASDTKTEVANKVNEPINKEENKTEENYKKSADILEKRLKELKVEDYTIRLNKENGTIMIELPEITEVTDSVVSTLMQTGKFEIIDSTTKEVLLNNSDIEKVEANIGQTSYGYVAYIGIQFNKQGTDKFKNVTNTYKTLENTTTNTQITEGEQEKKEEQKKISLQLDGQTIMTDSFEDEIANGYLQLTIGSASKTANSSELQTYYRSAKTEAALLNQEALPLVYKTAQNKYVGSDITIQNLKIAIGVVIGLIVIGIIYLIIRYHVKGLLASISFIGYIALLLLTVRYTNVTISIIGLIGIVVSIIINYILLQKLLKNMEKIEDSKLAYNKTMSNFLKIIVPIIIIAVVFSFSTHLAIFSFGMVMFWGIVLDWLYNFIVTKNLLKM